MCGKDGGQIRARLQRSRDGVEGCTRVRCTPFDNRLGSKVHNSHALGVRTGRTYRWVFVRIGVHSLTDAAVLVSKAVMVNL